MPVEKKIPRLFKIPINFYIFARDHKHAHEIADHFMEHVYDCEGEICALLGVGREHPMETQIDYDRWDADHVGSVVEDYYTTFKEEENVEKTKE